MYLMAAPERARPVRQGHRAERLHGLGAGAAHHRVTVASPAKPSACGWPEKLGADDLAGLRSMDAAEDHRRAPRRTASSRSSSSTAASCRARWSTCSIAASRRRCRCSRDSTAARSARCACSRRRCRRMRRPTKRRSARGYADLADAFLRLYPASNLQESIWATTRDSLYGWTAERLVDEADRARRAVLSSIYSTTAIPRRTSKGLHAFHASELPYVFGTAGPDAAELAESAGDAPPRRNCRTPCSSYWAVVRAQRRAQRRGPAAWPAYGRDARLHGVRRRAAAEDAPDARHVRVQRAGRVPAPRQGRHSLELERRARVAAAACPRRQQCR